MNQPLETYSDDIQLLRFDPMNLICSEPYCLHKTGQINIGENVHIIESPFLAEYEGMILNLKKLYIPADAIKP